MGLSPAAVLANAGALFRRDRELLLTVAGVFWFLPNLAVLLLVASPPAISAAVMEPDSAAQAAFMQAFSQWLASDGVWVLLATGIREWGGAALYALYLDRTRPDLAGALLVGARLWPRFMLLQMLIGAFAMVGLWFWVLPAVWVLARLMVAAPALVAERPIGVLAAVARSFRLSRGANLPLMAIAAILLALALLAPQPFVALAGWLRERPGGANVVAVTMAGVLAAVCGAAAALLSALTAVSVYRGLASKGI